MGIHIEDDNERGKQFCCILIIGIIIGLWFAGKSKGEPYVAESQRSSYEQLKK